MGASRIGNRSHGRVLPPSGDGGARGSGTLCIGIKVRSGEVWEKGRSIDVASTAKTRRRPVVYDWRLVANKELVQAFALNSAIGLWLRTDSPTGKDQWGESESSGKEWDGQASMRASSTLNNASRDRGTAPLRDLLAELLESKHSLPRGFSVWEDSSSVSAPIRFS